MGRLKPKYLLAALLASGCTPDAPVTDLSQETLADAAELCDLVRTDYAYYPDRQENWEAACAGFAGMLGPVTTKPEQLRALETLVDALYDPHATFGTHSGMSPRVVPSGSDYWLEGDRVTAVRPGSAAARAGLVVGDQIVAINGRPLADAIVTRLHPKNASSSETQKAWALNAAAAGYRDEPRSVTISRISESETLSLDGYVTDAQQVPLSSRILDGNVAYIRLHDSLGDSRTVAAFDAAMDTMREANSWIVDLRDTPGGGDTNVAEPILGRFLSKAAEYQQIRPTDAPEWVKTAEPHGDWTAKGPVAVLVGRWTGSMGEGLAIGFDGIERGEVFGSDMARLAGGVEDYRLSQTGFPIRLPAYDLAHLNGTPRHEWSPPYQVVADNGDGPDLALAAALDWFGRLED